MARFNMTFRTGTSRFSLTARASACLFRIGFESVQTVTIVPKYEGRYQVTPTQQEQTLQTEGLLMQEDVKIAPIPSNYGLITWNGAALTVS